MKIKEIVDELFHIAESCLVKVEELDAEQQKARMKRSTRREILNFLMYLSASDGSIEMQEALFLKDYFCEQISPEEICERIEVDNIYSTAFEQKVPLTLKRIVRRDNQKAAADELDISLGERYICLYEALGKEFIVCDREESENEKADLSTYIQNMRLFYVANYEGSEKATRKAHFEHKIGKDYINIANDNILDGDALNEDEVKQEETIEELLEQLNQLVGLRKVKDTVLRLVHYNAIRELRNTRGLKQPVVTMHMVFYGNPGTGKTTVARLIARIYHKLGILSKGQFVEVDRSGLVAGYVGQTALKVAEVVEKAKGGVLFIDEAYSLTYRRSENDFGREAVDTLIKAMEDFRDDLVVIVSGYTDMMGEFIESNPGLKSRFNNYIAFEDYTSDELFQIYKKMLNDCGFKATEETYDFVEEWIEEKADYSGRIEEPVIYGLKHKKKESIKTVKMNSGNARMVRNLLDCSIMNQADRLFGNSNISDEDLITIRIDDVKNIA